jgi:hypothetical protein
MQKLYTQEQVRELIHAHGVIQIDTDLLENYGNWLEVVSKEEDNSPPCDVAPFASIAEQNFFNPPSAKRCITNS